VAALLRGHPGAATVFHQRFAFKVRGLIYRIMGPDSELDDTVQDAFVRALEALPKLRDPQMLESWLMGVTVRTARTRLQKRSRRAWLRVLPQEELPESADSPDPVDHEAISTTYKILNRMGVDLRMPLVLRFAAGMTLTEAAAACGVSLATIKRRLTKAEQTFLMLAESEPALHGWLEPANS
jgi:RNA polymerase sigma-70 factor (ECF subfamily)